MPETIPLAALADALTQGNVSHETLLRIAIAIGQALTGPDLGPSPRPAETEAAAAQLEKRRQAAAKARPARARKKLAEAAPDQAPSRGKKDATNAASFSAEPPPQRGAMIPRRRQEPETTLGAEMRRDLPPAERAQAFLRDDLAQGPVALTHIEELARQREISPLCLEHAKAALDVVASRANGGKGVTLALP